jgi:lipoprotein-releasing system permease protein
MSFELFVALRYLMARRKQALVSLISAISMVGVTVGVMALLIALALMTGLQGELRDRIVGSAAQVFVFKAGEGGIADYPAEIAKLRAVPRVVAAAPVITGFGLMRAGGNEAVVTIKGVDPALEQTVTEVGKAIEAGSLTALDRPADARLPGIVIGRDLATKIGAFIGDAVTVVTAEGTLSPMGIFPGQRRLEVVGVYKLGLYEYDNAYAFVSLGTAKRLFDRDRVDFIELKVDDEFAAPEVAADITERLGPLYLTEDWIHMNQSLFSALWLEKYAIAITIGLIVMVAALNIVASLVLLVMEKHRDIAILKTMGASARSIRRIFVLQGLVIGLAGTLAGSAAGLTVIYVLDRYRVIHVPLDVYQIAYVPFRLQTGDFLTVVAAAIAICLLATIYPSRQAAKLDPATSLRYE